MLCPLSYAPSRSDIRGERLTLLTRFAVRRSGVSLPFEPVDRGVGADRFVRPPVGAGPVGRVALAVGLDRAHGVEQAADEQQSEAALDDGDPEKQRGGKTISDAR